MRHPERWQKKYLEPGEEFLATDFAMKVGEDGTIQAVTGVGPGEYGRRVCIYFGEGNVMVGKKITRHATGGHTHSPIYLEEATGRLYHVTYVGPDRRAAAQAT